MGEAVSETRDFKLHRGSLPELLDMMRKIVLSGLSYRISIVEWSDKRGLSANAQQHVWYKRISQFYGCDIPTAGNQSKLDFGLPILLADSDMGQKVDFLLKKIGFYSFTREQQVNVMDLIQVTSLFSTKQHNLYRDNLVMYWHEQGLELEYKESK
jgi:hypothetical protein